MNAIRLERESTFADSLRAYQVILNGEEIGRIRNGQQIELEVMPGKHQLCLKISWCGSNTVEFEAGAGTVVFECGPTLHLSDLGAIPYLGYLRAIPYLTYRRNEYLWLKLK